MLQAARWLPSKRPARRASPGSPPDWIEPRQMPDRPTVQNGRVGGRSIPPRTRPSRPRRSPTGRPVLDRCRSTRSCGGRSVLRRVVRVAVHRGRSPRKPRLPGRAWTAGCGGDRLIAPGSPRIRPGVPTSALPVWTRPSLASGTPAAGCLASHSPCRPSGRMAMCADPSGAAFRLWQPGTLKGAQAVNTPGTWNSAS